MMVQKISDTSIMLRWFFIESHSSIRKTSLKKVDCFFVRATSEARISITSLIFIFFSSASSWYKQWVEQYICSSIRLKSFVKKVFKSSSLKSFNLSFLTASLDEDEMIEIEMLCESAEWRESQDCVWSRWAISDVSVECDQLRNRLRRIDCWTTYIRMLFVLKQNIQELFSSLLQTRLHTMILSVQLIAVCCDSRILEQWHQYVLQSHNLHQIIVTVLALSLSALSK